MSATNNNSTANLRRCRFVKPFAAAKILRVIPLGIAQTMSYFPTKVKTPATLVVLSLLCVILPGCTSTIKRSGQMHPGMTRPEVIATLGEPDSTMSPGGHVEILRYVLTKQRLYRLAVPLRYDYLVRLENGKVIMYGSEADLIAAASSTQPSAAATEKTININVRSDSGTNAIAPVQPQLHLSEP